MTTDKVSDHMTKMYDEAMAQLKQALSSHPMADTADTGSLTSGASRMSAMITEAMRDAAANILAQADDCQYVFAKHYDLAEMVLAAALSTEPGEAEGWRPTHRHKKRSSTYRVIAEGRLQVDADLDNEKVVVYRGEDGQVWVRPTYEFNDGRFEALPAAPLPEDTHHG